jgi:hypothetical protein
VASELKSTTAIGAVDAARHAKVQMSMIAEAELHAVWRTVQVHDQVLRNDVLAEELALRARLGQGLAGVNGRFGRCGA